MATDYYEEEEDWGGEGERWGGAGEGLAFDFAAPPAATGAFEYSAATTAEEYLRMVALEAKGLPSVLVASEAEKLLAGSSEPGGAQRGASPSSSASGVRYRELDFDAFVSDFASLRAGVQRAGDERLFRRCESLPKRREWAAWLAFCLGDSATRPLMSVVSAIDEPMVPWLLERVVRSVASRPGVAPTEHQAQWVFALATKVDKPVSDDVSAAFRTLAKYCVAMLSGRGGDDSSQPSATEAGASREGMGEREAGEAGGAGRRDPEGPERDRLLLLLAIAGAYFGQDEVLAAKFAQYSRR